ncbi:MAG: succinate--CoA ligase [ADP-forming] subunit alpha [Tepidiforma sp.]|jgi:succinyl-CoA synthetase alpha subunit|uniref:Succinate--CoA ligase [ADP-forming] subunit alpha n=1 Tax=Tepidiforma thermophila (strain KCTC 52669 / CGMCC 1.13589 / G233) TaxID=2761530 RepID=A0A2A9HGQ2_TEPT2|nr:MULTISPECIES: succinate--CoA ligase subunit alpha [Tepidiforma]PFG74311.1 succinyl-CoA synthetase alpha subunit [Tepidiforma thermophila]GIW15859.1 MAG: succinate--CoA ligase [ADP-forming] subunit alpha [Tepidiforma sp.]
MAVLVDQNTRLLVQGIGTEGANHMRRSIAYGTNVVAAIHPKRGGEQQDGVPIFTTVDQAVRETGANVSIIFVPAPGAADAILEAAAAKIPLIVCITEGIPVLDMVRVKAALQSTGSILIGPNCPGVITPGTKTRVGIMPGDVFMPGRVGVVSRSGTLVYEVVAQLTAEGIGQSTCIGVGGDPIIGTRQAEAVRMLNEDPDTDAIVLVGEIGGSAEQEAAAYIKEHVRKPVVAFIAGATAPPGRRMGHAGAIISGEDGKAENKKAALRAAGAVVSDSPADIGATMKRILAERGLLR